MKHLRRVASIRLINRLITKGKLDGYDILNHVKFTKRISIHPVTNEVIYHHYASNNKRRSSKDILFHRIERYVYYFLSKAPNCSPIYLVLTDDKNRIFFNFDLYRSHDSNALSYGLDWMYHDIETVINYLVQEILNKRYT